MKKRRRYTRRRHPSDNTAGMGCLRCFGWFEYPLDDWGRAGMEIKCPHCGDTKVQMPKG